MRGRRWLRPRSVVSTAVRIAGKRLLVSVCSCPCVLILALHSLTFFSTSHDTTSGCGAPTPPVELEVVAWVCTCAGPKRGSWVFGKVARHGTRGPCRPYSKVLASFQVGNTAAPRSTKTKLLFSLSVAHFSPLPPRFTYSGMLLGQNLYCSILCIFYGRRVGRHIMHRCRAVAILCQLAREHHVCLTS